MGVLWRIFIGFLLTLLFYDQGTAIINNPKLIAVGGNLIFESGLNRNISFHLNGTSRLLINDNIDLLELLLSYRNATGPRSSWSEADERNYQQIVRDVAGMQTTVYGPAGLNKRLRNIQNRTTSNGAMLRYYRTRLSSMESKMNSIITLVNFNNCTSNPCQNGATCYDTFNDYVCRCRDGFEGRNCERDVDECQLYAGTDKGCQNGGQCLNQFGSFTCLCTSGWVGIHCAERKGDCLQASNWERCGHGTCVNINSYDDFGYKCICEPGWKTNGITPTCMTDIDECTESHPKCITKCINLPGTFMCEPCPPGLTGNGITCRDIDECATNNGGCSLRPLVQCLNSYGSYHCESCPLGWIGDGRTCTRALAPPNAVGGSCADANICHPSATCTEISNTVVCICKEGMVGTGVGVNGCVPGQTFFCNPNPCLNGGTCLDTGVGYLCACPPGYQQPNCMAVSNPCIPNPCHNNGRCRRTGPKDFQCQCPPGSSGRLCDNHHSRCGGLLAGNTGILKYPEGSLYEHNAQCSWLIRTNTTMVLNVTFDRFELEDSAECRFDFLQINDGMNPAARIIGRFCGTRLPMGGNIISSTHYLYLWFRSDNSTAKAGFELKWNSIAPQCGGIIEINSHGSITTPGSPGVYPKNRDCSWQLKAPNNKRIKLTFFSMQIEIHDDCNNDYVEITDSNTNALLEKFCNSSNPTPLILPTNEATIHFHSDGEGTDTGFQIYYSLEERIPQCGGTFSSKEDTISSPNTIESYVSCEYDIKVPYRESIRIQFTKFQMGFTDCIEFYNVNTESGERALLSKFCGGLNAIPVPFSSLYDHLHMVFYSKGGTFSLNFKAECSYTFDNDRDEFFSPNYPNITAQDELCTYKIIAEPGYTIVLNVIDFDLGDANTEDDNCAFTSLSIESVANNEMLGPYCNQKPVPLVFNSKTNLLTLSYSTSQLSRGRGFKVSYTHLKANEDHCGGYYTKDGQTITLPTGPEGTYQHNLECYWIIVAPLHQGILLNWIAFDLEQTMDCIYDFVEVFDGIPTTTNSKPLGRFCESHNPVNILTYSSVLTIKFISDVSDAGTGFAVTYNFVNHTSECGSSIYSSNGQLHSPGWPENYTNGLDCTWKINTPPGTQVELQIDFFELEDSPKCSSDWLEIRNGGSLNSTLVGYFCGKSILRRIPSFTNELHLHLHTDSFRNARGFQISWFTYSNGCGGILKSEFGVITSPFYPKQYAHNTFCEWRVFVKSGSIIHFNIEDMELESSNSCVYDYVEFYDGRTSNQMRLARVCQLQDVEGKEIVTSGSEGIVQFKTDSSSVERGFLISFYADCRHNITEHHGIIMSPNFDNPYYNNAINCSWTIVAPKGNRISIEFSYFDVKDREDGYVNVTDFTANGTILHNIRHVQSINSTGNILRIEQTNDLVSFRLEYAMIGCIATLHRDSGQFQSPNAPGMYPNNVECSWIIKTLPGHGIELDIEFMDIEQSENCTNDALQISHSPTSNNPKERYCGQQKTLKIHSTSSHILYVRFYSNGNVNGMGFNASYQINKTPKCGGVINAKNGVITSPNYPLNYPPNSDCEWTIEVSRHHTVSLYIDELDLEDSFECMYDYVEAVEDVDERGNVNSRIFKLCGTLGRMDVAKWTSTTNTITIRFISEDSAEAKGFKISFEENCGSNVMVAEDDWKYIHISQPVAVNKTCQWQLISVDPTKHIRLNPSNVQLTTQMALAFPTESDCPNNGVMIFDGIGNKSALRSKFCIEHPPSIISHGHALTITVPLNMISEFAASYDIYDDSCAHSYSAIRGKFATPNYPASYPVEVTCDWYIKASQGNSIVLTVEEMDLEDSEDCNHDYLEIRDKDERGKLYGIFCGKETPASFIASNQVWIQFSSDSDIVGSGLLMSYNYALHNEINGTGGIIESPIYPTVFSSIEPYSWRITVDKEYVIVLSMKHIRDIDMPFIKFYDGYSDIGAEISYSNSHIIQSSTNVLFFRASRGPFQCEWERLSKAVVNSNETAARMAEKCGTSIITTQGPLIMKSPGYPNGYEPFLNCSWTIMPANRNTHILFIFIKVDLETFSNCGADYATVSASNDLQHWKELSRVCERPNVTDNAYHGTPYLRLTFNTDSGVNKTGFIGIAHSACGSFLTDQRGFVNGTSLQAKVSFFRPDCVWRIRVRQGRRVRIRFEDVLIRNANDTNICQNYIVLRNGNDDDSPFLGKGKYCDNSIEDVLETTSNKAYVKFRGIISPKYKASFHYEEISHECSDDITLSEDDPLDRAIIITSPNYPNIPNAHVECVWRITAPVHHILAVHFVEQFDLATYIGPVKPDSENGCHDEYVQLNDGSTELMPFLGRFCGKTKPSTKYTTGNVLRVKYFTDISEPHIGFKANISIGRCGGLYYDSDAIIMSPRNLDLRTTENEEVECVYTIEVEQGSTINLTLSDLTFDIEVNCSKITHLDIQEIDTIDGVDNVTDTLQVCGNNNHYYIVETNKVVIRYKILMGDQRTFKIQYTANGHMCGSTLEGSAGILQTPEYPNGVSWPTHCAWHLIAPKGKRIRITFVDFDVGKDSRGSLTGRIIFANDLNMQSIIKRIYGSPVAEIYSTDNTMDIDTFLLPFGLHRGIKMRFTTVDSILCRHNINLATGGVINFEGNANSSVYCSYDLQVGLNETLMLKVTRFEQWESFSRFGDCSTLSPIRLMIWNHAYIPEQFCDKDASQNLPVTIRVPFPIKLIMSGNQRNRLKELNISYQIYKCGGMQLLDYVNNMTITEPKMPSNYRESLECAWVVWPGRDLSEDNDGYMDLQIVIKLATDFHGACEDQHLIIYNGPSQNSPRLGRFCGEASADNMVVQKGVLMEYYSKNYETASNFNVTFKIGSGCGGTLVHPYRDIIFYTEYGNNVECIWTIEADVGFHVGLSFINRFFIESSPNCRKDYIRIQQINSIGEWEDLATLCGRDPPASINTTTTQMRMIFRSDEETVGEGFTAHFDRNCGGIYHATSELQRIHSPGYPDKYWNLLSCNYTILPSNAADAGVMVRFIDFEVEEAAVYNCMFDNVSIVEQNSPYNSKTTVLCGTHKEYEFRGKERITVVLQTDRSYTYKGFEFIYTNQLCGGLITNTSLVESPRTYKQNLYPHETNCYWNLTAPENYKILLKFQQLDFESHIQCLYDGLSIYKGLVTAEDQRLYSFCGNLTGKLPVLTIPSNKGLIYTYSDHRDSSDGFKVLVTFMPDCDKRIFLDVNNSTYEFNTYAGGYANNLHCAYSFSTIPGRQLQIEFNSFHLDNTTDCRSDYLELYDGGGVFAETIGRFCGDIVPTKMTTSRNALYILFVTDSISPSVGTGTSLGFTARISTQPVLCGKHNLRITGSETITIKSPDAGDGNYPNNMNCFWKISAVKPIHIHFVQMDIATANNTNQCDGDYLQVYNSEDAELVEKGHSTKVIFNGHLNKVDYLMFATEHIYCGQQLPSDYYSSTGELFVRFKSDATGNGRGFHLTAMLASGCFRNFTGTQGHIKIDDTGDHCDIYITAPDNYTLSIYYSDVQFFEYDCNMEYVEVFDAHTNSSLQKICHNTELSKSLFSTTNALRMRIKINTYLTHYDMTYLASNAGPGCGGDLYDTTGIFTSPFYPVGVRNYSDCRWNIRVPSNVHVLLRFEVFDMGAKTTCHSDYLQILEHNDSGQMVVVQQYCGGDTPESYKSTKSYVTVRHKKTVNFDGTGWVIRFNGVHYNYKTTSNLNEVVLHFDEA